MLIHLPVYHCHDMSYVGTNRRDDLHPCRDDSQSLGGAALQI